MASKREFEKFYLANFDKIYRFVVFRVGGNKELAEDLVSEVFMKALEKFEQYDSKISASAWIFTIAKNHLANHWRDSHPTESLPEEDFLMDKAWFKLAGVKEVQVKEKVEIYDLLAKLNKEERENVTFHYIFGYSYLEIAKMRACSEGTIKVATHRAIKKLRDLI